MTYKRACACRHVHEEGKGILKPREYDQLLKIESELNTQPEVGLYTILLCQGIILGALREALKHFSCTGQPQKFINF